jgi:hypothetical protein
MKRAAMARLHVTTSSSSADTESIENRSQSLVANGWVANASARRKRE